MALSRYIVSPAVVYKTLPLLHRSIIFKRWRFRDPSSTGRTIKIERNISSGRSGLDIPYNRPTKMNIRKFFPISPFVREENYTIYNYIRLKITFVSLVLTKDCFFLSRISIFVIGFEIPRVYIFVYGFPFRRYCVAYYLP